MSVVLRRWHTATLTEEVIPLATTYIYCARCGRMAPAHLAERDPFTREFVHAGNCPYTRPAEVAAPVTAEKSRARQMREAAAERQKQLRRLRTGPKPDPTSVEEVARVVERHAARMRPPVVAPPSPTPERVRWLHEQARRRAEERHGAATGARPGAGGGR